MRMICYSGASAGVHTAWCKNAMVYSVAAAATLTVVTNDTSATVSAAGAWPSSAKQHYDKYEAGQSVSVS